MRAQQLYVVQTKFNIFVYLITLLFDLARSTSLYAFVLSSGFLVVETKEKIISGKLLFKEVHIAVYLKTLLVFEQLVQFDVHISSALHS